MKDQLIRGIVATDKTFARDGRGWLGKCLHCNAKLAISDEGEPIGDATIEHIVPRVAGGGDDLPNLALACARCNREKGWRHDWRASDPRAREVTEKLLAKRRERWRDPDFARLLETEPQRVLDTPELFLRWADGHKEHRFAVAEAQEEVCAKPRELAARVLEKILEEE